MRSSLEIFDMKRRTSRVIWQSAALFEAPNWHPDGSRLLINGNGRLYWIGLDGSDPELIDTQAETACNNDHGISPDGQWLVFSGKAIAGEACMFKMKADGGPLHRVSAQTPSYWHGWSPDSATLAYCARRGGVYHIATCDADGAGERILTADDSHHDGPDFTPDGRWIWFNSDKSGSSELWRIRPDGSQAEQMTDDERVNWFPHPSPDGQHVIYVAYPEGTLQHPRDLDVELRRVNPDGTGTETLVELFGGQGTINVPCWAPDSHAFAYMRYAPEA